jgi:hypothetical protein
MQGSQQTGERNFFEPVYTRMASGGLAGGMNDDASYPMANINRNAYGYSTQQTPMMGAQDAGIDVFTGEQRMADGGVTDDVAYPAVVVYGPDGKMYSSPQVAIEAGVTNYTMTPPENTAKAPVDPYAPGSRLASVSGTDTIDYVYDPKTFKFERVNRPASTAPEGGATPGVDAGGGAGDMGAGMSDSAFADANFGDAAIAAADAYAAADAQAGDAAFGSASFGDAAAGDLGGLGAGDLGGLGAGDLGGLGAGDMGSFGGDASGGDASGGDAGGSSGGDAGGGDGGGGGGDGGGGGGGDGGYAYGGLSALAHGGMSHLGDYSDGGRLLRGPGDGVSDSIPATIANKRPARLADGEFVVPARIVSELGNGSTEAGARKLYAMMDRIQRARGKTVGKGKVAKNSRADRYLPA